MMVKNEEKNLERCLDSLKVFLDDPLVELIIIDTGSTDKTVDIAKKYTSKLYFHEWNNNFSEMRNISISYATGKWLFLIDGDECLEDPIKTFKLLIENDLENYNTIQFNIKSYLNMSEDSNYSVLPQPRVFRNDGTFRYEGTVHNQPIFKAPILDTDVIVEHYGYISTDNELMERKFQRTATILKEELKKNPNNPYYQYQLAASYSMYGDSKKTLEEIRKAYKIIEKSSKKEKRLHIYMYGTYVRTAFTNNEFNETISICKEGIELQPEHLDLYFVLANAFLVTGERTKAIQNFNKYIDLLNSYDNLPISKDSSIIMYNLDSQSIYNAYFNVASYYYDNKEFKKAYKYLKKLENKSDKNNLMCKILIKLELYDELKLYYNELNDKYLIRNFTISIENEIKKLDKKIIDEIADLFKDNDDEYGLFSKIKLEVDNKDILIKEFLSKYDLNDLPIFYGEIFKEIRDDRIYMISFKKVNNHVLRQYVGLLINEKDSIMKEYLFNFLISNKDKIRDNDYQSNRVYCAIANIILIKSMEGAKQQEKILEEKYVQLFDLYLEKGFNCLEYKYDIRKIRMIYSTLDITEDKFLMIMYLVKESIDNENIELAIKYMREALKEYPHMAKALQEYQKQIFKDIKI
ncbi:glycosyltransferase family 2 protein [Tissierella carlieri]|nr:glycosyltransferase family 2 protein [Tissierella carlieri]